MYRQHTHAFGDTDTLAMKPVFTQVTTYHETIIVWFLADAPQPIWIIFRVPAFIRTFCLRVILVVVLSTFGFNF